jgi:dTDP-4-dehydrorhamnose reductase
MRILLTGRDGQVGWELNRTLAPLGEVIAPDRGKLDLGAADSITRAVREARPAVIVNAAAYTAVDRAESEPELAMRVNGVAPGILAEEARRLGALLVHYSTDYVFDGTEVRAYLEDDAPAPLNEYGRTKLAGERAIRASAGAHYIFRTSWVYAARGSNFVRTILRLARERSELRIVDDQIGAPTWARAIAEMTAQVLSGVEAGNARERAGLYHFTAAGAVSWCGFAQAILDRAQSTCPDMSIPRLVPIPSSEYPLPARRPRNSRLDTSRLAAAFGLVPQRWDDMLGQCMQEVVPAPGKPVAPAAHA